VLLILLISSTPFWSDLCRVECFCSIVIILQLMHGCFVREGGFTLVLACPVTSDCPISHQLSRQTPSAGDAWIFVSIVEFWCLYFCWSCCLASLPSVHLFLLQMDVCIVGNIVIYVSNTFPQLSCCGFGT
jgi:hypothetical protein